MKSTLPQSVGAAYSHRLGSGGGATAVWRDMEPRTAGCGSDHLGFEDHDVFGRHIAVAALAAGLHLLDLVDDVPALDHLAEHRIAPAGRRLGLEVQEVVVGRVDEELRGGRMRHA